MLLKNRFNFTRSCAFAQKAKFYALKMLKKQIFMHPKAAKLATLNVAYCKHSDLRMIKGDITFDLCMSINNVLPRQAVCAQKLKPVWAARLQDAEAVKTLLRRGVTIQRSHIDFYPVNPLKP